MLHGIVVLFFAGALFFLLFEKRRKEQVEDYCCLDLSPASLTNGQRRLSFKEVLGIIVAIPADEYRQSLLASLSDFLFYHSKQGPSISAFASPFPLVMRHWWAFSSAPFLHTTQWHELIECPISLSVSYDKKRNRLHNSIVSLPFSYIKNDEPNRYVDFLLYYFLFFHCLRANKHTELLAFPNLSLFFECCLRNGSLLIEWFLNTNKRMTYARHDSSVTIPFMLLVILLSCRLLFILLFDLIWFDYKQRHWR